MCVWGWDNGNFFLPKRCLPPQRMEITFIFMICLHWPQLSFFFALYSRYRSKCNCDPQNPQFQVVVDWVVHILNFNEVLVVVDGSKKRIGPSLPFLAAGTTDTKFLGSRGSPPPTQQKINIRNTNQLSWAINYVTLAHWHMSHWHIVTPAHCHTVTLSHWHIGILHYRLSP